MIIVDLIFRLSILVALSVFSGFIDIRFNRTKIVGKIIQGLLFGGTAIVGMLDPVILSEGIIFDGRSVVISLSTLFFGPLTGIISSVLAILFRLHIGGAGALMGILVILSSYLIGLIFNYRHRLGHSKNFPNRELYLMGIFVHLTMITLMLTLPFKEISTAFHTIALTVTTLNLLMNYHKKKNCTVLP
jgi:LytS/YehU family sensor histidine kinase